MLCCDVPVEYGGPGGDWLFNVVVIEELARAGITGPGFAVHSEMVAPYIVGGAAEALKSRWLPLMVRGEAVGALAMTEPQAGTDVRNIRTSVRRDGDHLVINGQKTYISNGQLCDIVVVACRFPEAMGEAGGISLVLVETDRPGFSRGRNLEKIGYKAQDTSELFFSGVRVPRANLIGEPGEGLRLIIAHLAQERLSQAIRSIAVAEWALEWTVRYTRERRLFEGAVIDFQNTRFKLAELDAQITAIRVFVDYCIETFRAARLTSALAAKAKLLATELHGRVVDECLQFFGGYGYMTDNPIARAYCDARVTRIAGGASEVLKQLIASDLLKRYADRG